MIFNFYQIPSPTTELAALERLNNDYNVVSTLTPSFLIGSYLFLHVTRTAIKNLDWFEIRQDLTQVYEVSFPCTSEKFSIDL